MSWNGKLCDDESNKVGILLCKDGSIIPEEETHSPRPAFPPSMQKASGGADTGAGVLSIIDTGPAETLCESLNKKRGEIKAKSKIIAVNLSNRPENIETEVDTTILRLRLDNYLQINIRFFERKNLTLFLSGLSNLNQTIVARRLIGFVATPGERRVLE